MAIGRGQTSPSQLAMSVNEGMENGERRGMLDWATRFGVTARADVFGGADSSVEASAGDCVGGKAHLEWVKEAEFG